MYEKFGQFIDGKWQQSSGGETYEVINPATEEILGKVLVTPQTGPKGKKVNRLYIENGCLIDKEFYFSILVDNLIALSGVI